MRTILGIPGSLRRGSYNRALLEVATKHTPEGYRIEIEPLHGIPLYDGDVEAEEGLPERVVELKARFVAADGLLFATPEYNNSLPGVMKNAVDWLSRPPADIASVFQGKPVGLVGASPSGFGTILSQTAWLPVLRALKTRPYFDQSLRVSGASKVFDERGRISDAELDRRLAAYIEDFCRFVDTVLGAR